MRLEEEHGVEARDLHAGQAQGSNAIDGVGAGETRIKHMVVDVEDQLCAGQTGRIHQSFERRGPR